MVMKWENCVFAGYRPEISGIWKAGHNHESD